jgi:c-di-GMP-binding flagellar brake protein YcgR
MLERRRSERFSPDQDIYARIKSSIPVRIVDVSRHGMQVESTSALPPSGECDIWLPTNDGDVRMRIRVQRCRARFVQSEDGFRGLVYQAGIEFLEVSDAARSALISIVEKIDSGDVSDESLTTAIGSGAEDVRDVEEEDADQGVSKAV